METKKDVTNWIDANQRQFTEMADEIWANPEVRWLEFKASKLQADYLEEVGFDISWDSGDITTAFIAEWKQGDGDGPIIGFLGEYDALPGLSQAVDSIQKPIEPGGNGHGCGHNLLGTGALAATVALKQWLQATNTPGTIRYYGCPAEEGGGGKVFMLRAGAFDDLSAAFNFHPAQINMASKGSSLSVNRILFRFHGRTAHAGGAPHLGRSALDAVELMNVGVNYLREHVPPNTRFHYTITHGGEAPNIVPDFAEVFYYIRAHMPEDVAEVTERIVKVAKGAAMMTETESEVCFVSASTALRNNHTLSDLQYETMKMLGPIEFSNSELAFAAEINEKNPPGTRKSVQKMLGIPSDELDTALLGAAFPASDAGIPFPGSTDVGDVSWVTPLSLLSTACWPVNVNAHTWGVVATGGMSIGHKGMLYAAKVMAGSAVDLFTNPEKLAEVRAEFEAQAAAHPYVLPLPDDCHAPHNPHPLRE